MQLALALLAVAFIGTASCLNMDRKIDAELDPHWETFKLMYRKQYDSQFEVARRIIWESNLKRIQSHNLRYDMGHHSYSMGMNQFGDLTPKEFRALYLGRKRPMRKQSNPSHFMAPLNVKDDPDTLDWRTQGYVTPIKDQGQCGSCWAFSATGSLEGQYFRKNKNLLTFSEQQLVDCSGDQGNEGCDGGLMDQAFEYVKLKGIEQEADYPYTAQDGNCVYDASKVVFNCTGETDIPSGDEKALKHAVASQGPISVAIDASNDSFQFYKDGVYDEPACSSEQLDHGVLAIGYGALSGKSYWLVKNSWGTSWGQQGYIFMSKDKNNQCGIATLASYPNL